MSVDPSSLIFVVIIGIWAVYLVQHWVRRREQLATSRSVDRFSAAMRVLERRAPIPVPLPASMNRPYVVAPAPVRPMPAAGSPEVAMKIVGTQVGTQVGVRVAKKQTPKSRKVRSHRLRGLILVAFVVATPACWAAHVWGTLLLWPAVTVTVALLLDLLYVRAAVRRASARRAAARRPATQPAPARRPRARVASPSQQAKPFPAPIRRPVRAGTPAMVRSRVGSEISAAGHSRTSAAVSEPEARGNSQEAITEVIVLDGGWEPVSVPPPTYTMKAKADRPPELAAELQADSESAPSRQPLQPAIVIDELDLDSVLERRRAAGE